MKEKITLFFLLLLLTFLQSTILPLNLILLAILSVSVLKSTEAGLVWAFLAGLILDFLTGETLGFSSLVFLMAVFLLNLYKTKFQAANFLYLLPFTFLSAWVYTAAKGDPVSWLNLIITTLLIFVVWPILALFIVQKEGENLQLPLKL